MLKKPAPHGTFSGRQISGDGDTSADVRCIPGDRRIRDAQTGEAVNRSSHEAAVLFTNSEPEIVSIPEKLWIAPPELPVLFEKSESEMVNVPALKTAPRSRRRCFQRNYRRQSAEVRHASPAARRTVGNKPRLSGSAFHDC